MPSLLKKAIRELVITGIFMLSFCFLLSCSSAARACFIRVRPTLPIPKRTIFMVLFIFVCVIIPLQLPQRGRALCGRDKLILRYSVFDIRYWIFVSCCSFISTNALLKSWIRSSASSIPHDKRMSESLIPDCKRRSRGMEACVICAGWQSKLLTPPRLSASLKYWVLVTNWFAASCVSSFSEKETTPPYNPFCCALAISWFLCETSPG